jgi:hypothetical protein
MNESAEYLHGRGWKGRAKEIAFRSHLKVGSCIIEVTGVYTDWNGENHGRGPRSALVNTGVKDHSTSEAYSCSRIYAFTCKVFSVQDSGVLCIGSVWIEHG